VGIKIKQYTALGKRITALCGNQHRIAAALGLDRSMVSRKLRGETALTVDELTDIANHFKLPIRTFFAKDDIDDDVFGECYRMFSYDAFALDRIIVAFNMDKRNLRKLGAKADEMRRAHNREKVRRSAISGR